MRMKPALLPILLLAACGAKTDANESAAAPRAGKVQASAAAAKPASAAKAVLVEKKTPLYTFTYGWPALAAAIPALDAQLRKDMTEVETSTRETATEDRKAAKEGGYPFNGHSYNKVWKSLGNSPRLLSLYAKNEVYSGGAHGNSFYNTILWDKTANQAVALFDLFANKGRASALIGARYCPNLDEERAKRRGETLPLEGKGWLVECPTLENFEIAPVDADGNGRFERLRILVPPYEAGSYAEGSYEVDVTMSVALKALLKPEYRSAF
ncbi:MAG TPA: DUF4163 domain-containing protein [Allosphingosinicella sp.]